MTIQSKDNEKLKLVRKLADRKHRRSQGLFVTEGEDLLEAGRESGLEPTVLLTRAGSGLGGDEVEPELLDGVSQLGSGTRAIAAWQFPAAERAGGAPMEGLGARSAGEGGLCVYLHGVGDPGNV
ncbi:MAG: hypothetical protein M3Y34_01275, partial [Actinomycetota bacterium]|nr:hypothetical protein [Actinomycetota bacterium]